MSLKFCRWSLLILEIVQFAKFWLCEKDDCPRLNPGESAHNQCYQVPGDQHRKHNIDP